MTLGNTKCDRGYIDTLHCIWVCLFKASFNVTQVQYQQLYLHMVATSITQYIFSPPEHFSPYFWDWSFEGFFLCNKRLTPTQIISQNEIMSKQPSKSGSESMKRRLKKRFAILSCMWMFKKWKYEKKTDFLHYYHVCECFAKCQKPGFLSHLTFHLMLINWTKAKHWWNHSRNRRWIFDSVALINS